MGLDVNRHADFSRSAVGHDQMSSRAILAMLDSTSGRSIDGLCARGTAICEMTLECGLVSRMRSSALTADPPGGGPKRAAPAAGGRGGMGITIADSQAARRTIAGQVLRTPMLPAPKLSALTAAEVYVKYENLQVTNSFKDRGALNKLASLSAAERGRGVIAMSAGNHAQAVAYHAARVAIPATIVMPVTTPFGKGEATPAHGAEVVLEGETVAEAQVRAETIARERGLTFVHPYDDPLVIAGQGTIALEMLEDAPGLDALVVPIGGGGLIAGNAIAARARKPAI